MLISCRAPSPEIPYCAGPAAVSVGTRMEGPHVPVTMRPGAPTHEKSRRPVEYSHNSINPPHVKNFWFAPLTAHNKRTLRYRVAPVTYVTANEARKTPADPSLIT